jgi:hypothetical protein
LGKRGHNKGRAKLDRVKRPSKTAFVAVVPSGSEDEPLGGGEDWEKSTAQTVGKSASTMAPAGRS